MRAGVDTKQFNPDSNHGIAQTIEVVQNGSVEVFGAKARRFVGIYNWDNITNEFERILEEIIKEKRNGTVYK